MRVGHSEAIPKGGDAGTARRLTVNGAIFVVIENGINPNRNDVVATIPSTMLLDRIRNRVIIPS